MVLAHNAHEEQELPFFHIFWYKTLSLEQMEREWNQHALQSASIQFATLFSNTFPTLGIFNAFCNL